MADNLKIKGSSSSDAAEVALDELTTLNGASLAPGDRVLAQRVKLLHGDDGSGRDTSTAFPLPVTDAAIVTALGLLLTELAQKVEPADLAALATGAKQDAAKTTLDAISSALAHGAFAYKAGTAAATIDVPSGGRVKRITILAAESAATVTIAGGDTITIPAGGAFDEQIPGDAPLGGDVVIGGTVASYYVSWVA